MASQRKVIKRRIRRMMIGLGLGVVVATSSAIRLLAHVRKSGTPRGAHDLIIAAHAAETGRTIVSKDAKARFSDLPGVASISV